MGLGRHHLNGQAVQLRDGDRIVIAIRPENLTLSRAEHGPVLAGVPGRVEARQYLGGRQILHVALDGRTAPVAVATAAHPGADPWEGSEGKPVWLTWRPDAVTVLDRD